LKIYTFEIRGQITRGWSVKQYVKATTLHTALYKLGKRLENAGEKFKVGNYNYTIILKQIETETKKVSEVKL